MKKVLSILMLTAFGLTAIPMTASTSFAKSAPRPAKVVVHQQKKGKKVRKASLAKRTRKIRRHRKGRPGRKPMPQRPVQSPVA
jgi:hypothetical protein